MGNCSCANSQVNFGGPDDLDRNQTYSFDEPSRSRHKVMSADEAMSRYKSECTMEVTKSGSHLELRALLDYPLGREFLLENSKFAPPFAHMCLTGWLDIQSFNAMVDGPAKITMAHSIYKKYVQDNSIVNVVEQGRIAEIVAVSPNEVVTGLFDQVRCQLFSTYNQLVFVDVRRTQQYKIMCAALRRKYNSVKQSDFLYHHVLGQGGFGLVLEVSKISTGERYAMKLLRKEQMVKLYGNEPWRAKMEKRAMASCHHPFIVELFFAFRTTALAGLVISLGTGLDLSKVLRASGPLTIDQVKFYAAEITSALSYLHHKGLIYRDLKPANVLLNLDGHVQLTDFGCVCDVSGELFSDVCDVEASIPRSALFVEALPVKPEAAIPPLSKYWSEHPAASAGTCPGTSAGYSDVGYTTTRSRGDPSDGPPVCLDNVGLSGTSSGPDHWCLLSQVTSPPFVLTRLRRKFYELTEAEIVRHLLASGCNYNKTVDSIETYLVWRQSFLTFTVLPPLPSSGCSIYQHGHDLEGHPLIILKSHLVDRSEERNLDEFLQWMVHMYECAINRLPPHLEHFTVLISRIGRSDTTDFELADYVFGTTAKRYPYRVHKILVYPSSLPLQAVGGILRNLMGRQAKLLHFVKSLNALRKDIPDEYIPVEMGGSCTYEFDMNDCPAPTVCTEYEYCREHGLSAASTAHDLTFANGSSSISDSLVKPTSQSSSSSSRREDCEDERGVEKLPATRPRAKSIAGTINFMAPEMMIMFIKAPGLIHTGYTDAVDWWSLGVVVYRLLTSAFPFAVDLPRPASREAQITAWSDRYSALLREVDYRMFGGNSYYPDVVDFLSQLLTVEDSGRLGYGPNGSSAVSAHKFFRDINWIELEKKESKPPPLPAILRSSGGDGEGDEREHEQRAARKPTPLRPLLELIQRDDYLMRPPNFSTLSSAQRERTEALNEQLETWDYTSPAAALLELQTRTETPS